MTVRRRSLALWRREAKKKTRQLWEQEFSLVKEGLAEDQVVQFVNELIARHRVQLEQRERIEAFPSLRAKQIVAEAERAAANLRLTARKEAEAEAARLEAEARQRAQEIVSEAKNQAKTTAEQEAQGIINTASQKAALTEAEALQRAHLFLLRAQEEVQSRLASETKGVYHRLLSSLQDLLTTAERVEAEWGSRQLQPSWGKLSELKDYQSTMLGTTMAGERDTEGLSGEEAAQEPVAQAKAVGESLSPFAKEVSPLEQEAVTDIAQELRARPEETPIPEPTEERGRREVTSTRAQRPAIRERAKEESATKVEQVSGGPRIYSGEVDLVLASPVNAARVTALYNHLNSIPDLKIVRTAGSWDRGTVVTVTLDKPLALIDLLSNIPALEVTPVAPGAGFLKGLAEKGKPTEHLKISFKDQQTVQGG